MNIHRGGNTVTAGTKWQHQTQRQKAKDYSLRNVLKRKRESCRRRHRSGRPLKRRVKQSVRENNCISVMDVFLLLAFCAFDPFFLQRFVDYSLISEHTLPIHFANFVPSVFLLLSFGSICKIWKKPTLAMSPVENLLSLNLDARFYWCFYDYKKLVCFITSTDPIFILPL